jgi:birA, biotin-[acetyl-CoA-carboxylase] ligase region
MKHFHFDRLDSTSTYCSTLLNQKVPPPFAVSAKEQLYGKGRVGKSWISPKGNLYVSIALTAPLNQSSYIPLKSAVILAEWIHHTFNVYVTLKWPNDILFRGKKIAGILCESFLSTNETQHIIIGIGVNIHKAPTKLTDYKTICFQHIFLKTWPIANLQLSLINWWQAYWNKLDKKELTKRYSKYHISHGQIWQDSENKMTFFSYLGLNYNGYLSLQNISSHKQQSIISANNHVRWIYQDRETATTPPLLVADMEIAI